jgi:hypothetical protein
MTVMCPFGLAWENLFKCGNPWKGEDLAFSWVVGSRSSYVINRGVAAWHRGNATSGMNCAGVGSGGSNEWDGLLITWEVECEWKHKKTTSERSWIANRAEWHVFWYDGSQDLGYKWVRQQIFRNGDRRNENYNE